MSISVLEKTEEAVSSPAGMTRANRWSIRIAIGLVVIISLMDLAGWIFDIPVLKSFGPFWHPMKASAAVCFLAVAASLTVILEGKPERMIKIIPVFSAILILLFSLLAVSCWIYFYITGNEASISNIPFFRAILFSAWRIRLLTAIIFAGISVIMLLLVSGSRKSTDIAHLLCFLLSIGGYLIPISYLINAFTSTKIIHSEVALNTGVAFCAVFAAVFLLKPGTWLTQVFFSKESGGIMARRLLPWIMILPIFIELLRISGESSGTFISEIGSLLVGIAYTYCFVLLVWFTGRSLNRIDRRRRASDERVKKSYDELEIRVRERTEELISLNRKLDEEIKERRKAEILVDSERARINGLLEKIPAYLILLTEDYHVAYSNRFFRERFGKSNGRKCYEFLFNRDEHCEICETYKVLQDGQPHTWEWTGPDNNIYAIYDFPYSDPDGSPMIMEMGIDVTSLKVAEEKLVILNSELEQRVTERTAELLMANERLDILSQTSGRLLVSDNPQGLINSLCSRVMKFLDCQLFFNFMVDPGKGKLVLNAYAGIPDAEAEKIRTLDFGVAVCGCVAKEGQRIVAENIGEIPDPRTDLVRSYGVKAYACFPLMSKDKVIGTLSFGTNNRTAFSPEDLSMMKTVADQAAIALARVQNEESLRRSEERYRSLMELSPGASFVSRDNKIVMLNSAARNLLGVTSAEAVIGKSPFEIFHPDYHESIREKIETILEGGTVPTAIEKIFRADGSVRDVEVVASGIQDHEGRAVQVIMSDITERKIAEEELYHTKNYLQNLIDYANAPIIVWDQENRIRLFNHAFEHLTGYNSSEVEGETLEMLFPKESLKDSMEKIKGALTENWVTIEVPILAKNGETRIAMWNSAKIYDEGRQTFSTIAQGNDITERIKAERAFKESKEKLDIALENGRIGTWEWEIGKDIFRWDERMGKMLGMDSGIFTGTLESFEKSIHEEDIQHVRMAFDLAVRKDIPLDTVYRVRNNEGAVNFFSTKALVARDPYGNAVKMSGVCFDITEMKKGAERTLILLNEELLRSNKELEQFAYVASHDLQEPLRMVSSFTQLLAHRYKDKLDNDAQEFIRFAVDGAIRMQVLINDLLNYSRIETKGKKFSNADMNAIVEQAVSNLNLNLTEKKAKITWDVLPEIVADEGQMVQLMQNLIGNAIKFNQESPVIHISASEGEDKFQFSVKDNGIGIENQYYDKIFQIFQRLHPKEVYGGTGIGLAICKRIIERHGGRIWVESEPGKGSDFRFTIIKR